MIEAPKFEPGQQVYYKGDRHDIGFIQARRGDEIEWKYHLNHQIPYAKESELSSALPEDLQYLIIDPIPIPKETYYFRSTLVKVFIASERYTPKWQIKETLDD